MACGATQGEAEAAVEALALRAIADTTIVQVSTCALARWIVAQMTRRGVSELLSKALELSSQERGLLAARLIDSLDDEPEEAGVEAAWHEEIAKEFPDGVYVVSVSSRSKGGISKRSPFVPRAKSFCILGISRS